MMRYSKPILRPLDDEGIRGLSCWPGMITSDDQYCRHGGTAAKSCDTGGAPFTS